MAKTNRDEQKVVIYSNRPPKDFKGGAVKVIAGLPVKVWVGPSENPIKDDVWAGMTESKKAKLEGPREMNFLGNNFRFTHSLFQNHGMSLNITSIQTA